MPERSERRCPKCDELLSDFVAQHEHDWVCSYRRAVERGVEALKASDEANKRCQGFAIANDGSAQPCSLERDHTQPCMPKFVHPAAAPYAIKTREEIEQEIKRRRE